MWNQVVKKTLSKVLFTRKSDFEHSFLIGSDTVADDSQAQVLETLEQYFYLYLIDDKTALNTGLSKYEKSFAAQVERVLKDPVQRRANTPHMPMVIPKILRCLREEDSAMAEAVNLIKEDPVLAGSVLKRSNSPYYRTGRSIESIEKASLNLGINGLYALMTSSVMEPIISQSSKYFSGFGAQLWQHSLLSACACEQMALMEEGDRFSAYLMGLIHDVGKIVVYTTVCKKMSGLTSADRSNVSAQVLKHLMLKYGRCISHWLAKDWELDESLVGALSSQQSLDAKPAQMRNILSKASLASKLTLVQSKNVCTDETAEALFSYFEIDASIKIGLRNRLRLN